MKHTGIVIFLFASVSFALPKTVPADWKLAWSDEFNGAALDTTAWSCIETRYMPSSEMEWYTGNCVSVENGNLVIWSKYNPAGSYGTLSAATAKYTSGRIESRKKKEFTFGYFETRLLMPIGQVKGPGLWSAVWLLGAGIDDPKVGWPSCGEIELYEQRCGDIVFTSHDPQISAPTVGDNEFVGTCHFKGNDGSVSLHSQMVTSSTCLCDRFHTFGILWDSSHVEYYVDDSLYWGPNFPTKEFSTPSINQDSNKTAFHGPFFWIINVVIGSAYQGSNVKNAIFPTKMLVDYVRVYQKNPSSRVVKDAAPYHPSANFALVNPASARLQVYDLRGVMVADYTDNIRAMKPGENALKVLHSPMSRGVCVARLFDGGRVLAKTVVAAE
jgi:beta-glucanase (GH16 family)